jgi:hypothetical protein
MVLGFDPQSKACRIFETILDSEAKSHFLFAPE